MAGSCTKVVLDTNVLVDHLLARCRHSTATIYHLKERTDHKVVVCDKLLSEYRDNPAVTGIRPVFDSLLMNHMPLERMERHPDPVVRIAFGPEEDRFHMQLAIDARVQYHVSKDAGVLNCSTPMDDQGVREIHPRSFVEDCRHGRP